MTMTRHTTPTRRRLLGSIAVATTAGFSGCATSSSTEVETPDGFEQLRVDGTALVCELEPEHTLDAITVIQPNGELFVERALAVGVQRETIDLGVDYLPGEYEIIGLSEGSEQSSSTITIEPEIEITDLRLGRNHPSDMYNDASDLRTRTEVILTLKNTGTGPDAAVELNFDGDIPGGIPENSQKSGIYDTKSDLGGHADQIVLPPHEMVTIYSHSLPFTLASGAVSCSPETEHGEFTATVRTAVQESNPSQQYDVTYTGEDLANCDIEVQ